MEEGLEDAWSRLKLRPDEEEVEDFEEEIPKKK